MHILSDLEISLGPLDVSCLSRMYTQLLGPKLGLPINSYSRQRQCTYTIIQEFIDWIAKYQRKPLHPLHKSRHTPENTWGTRLIPHKKPAPEKKTKNTWENPCIPWNAFCQWANYLALCAVRLAASAAYMNMKMNIESSGATCPRLPATFRCFILFLQSLRMLMYQSYFSYTYTYTTLLGTRTHTNDSRFYVHPFSFTF